MNGPYVWLCERKLLHLLSSVSSSWLRPLSETKQQGRGKCDNFLGCFYQCWYFEPASLEGICVGPREILLWGWWSKTLDAIRKPRLDILCIKTYTYTFTIKSACNVRSRESPKVWESQNVHLCMFMGITSLQWLIIWFRFHTFNNEEEAWVVVKNV